VFPGPSRCLGVEGPLAHPEMPRKPPLAGRRSAAYMSTGAKVRDGNLKSKEKRNKRAAVSGNDAYLGEPWIKGRCIAIVVEGDRMRLVKYPPPCLSKSIAPLAGLL
jgi:hypothetical protein